MAITFEQIEAKLLDTEVVPIGQVPTGMEDPGPLPDPILSELIQKGGYLTVDPELDGAQNRFISFVWNNGYGAKGRIIQRSKAGANVKGWEILPGTIQGIQHKFDSIGLVIDGADVVAYMTSHGLNTEPRIMALWEAKLVGVAVPISYSPPPVVYNEPCVPPANLNYFRPNAPITRGQVAKLIAQALGWTDDPGQQMFQDVPPTDPNYAYIQRLARRGISGGYRCKP